MKKTVLKLQNRIFFFKNRKNAKNRYRTGYISPAHVIDVVKDLWPQQWAHTNAATRKLIVQSFRSLARDRRVLKQMILFAMDDDQSSQAAFLTAQLHRLLKDAKSPTERHQIDVCLRVLPMEPSRPHPYTHSHQPSPIHFHS